MERKTVFPALRHWWTYQRIQKQIFLSLLIIAMFGIGILGNVSYQISRDTVETNYKKSHQASLRNSEKVMDMNLDSIIEMMRSFLNNGGLQHVLSSQTQDGNNTFSMEEQRQLKGVIEQLTTQESLVNSVAFMDLYGHYYLLSNVNEGTFEFYRYYKEHDFLTDEWSAKAKEAGGKEVFFANQVLGGVQDNGFSLVKYLNHPSTGDSMGYIVVNVSRSLLAKSFIAENEGYATNEYLIVTEEPENQLVYSGGERNDLQAVMQAYEQQDSQNTYLFSEVDNDTTGWTLVNVIEREELSTQSKSIRMTVLLVGAGVVLLCFCLARIISKNITRPLNQLESVIEQVGEGERHISEQFDDSEAGQIGQKFKEMVNTNLELSEHLLAARLNEREAELLLLQSQINPHFLYNTLDSLYCVAIIHGDDQIAEMILALSDNFKLSLNKGEKFSTVSDAVQQIQEYMKLQNLRFGGRFELNIEITEEILPRKILTFILQPFVENAIYHGLEPKLGKGKIRIRGWQEETKMIFTIEDNGVGMDDLSVLESGYGIGNVRERIVLHYGEEYGFSAKSEKGKGTKITITVPVK